MMTIRRAARREKRGASLYTSNSSQRFTAGQLNRNLCATAGDDFFARSDVEAEQHHVAIAHDIILALRPHHAFFPRALPAAVRHEVLVRHRFGANEAALEIRVDHSRGDWRCVAALDCPRSYLRVARG